MSFCARFFCQLVLVFALAACAKVSIRLDDLSCDNGMCLSGYICHPQTDLCVPAIAVGCDSASAYCASEIASGDTCPVSGAYIACEDGRTDCTAGCRTCQTDLTWSACTGATCDLTNGGVEVCDGVDNDCDGDVDEGVNSACISYYKDVDGDGFGDDADSKCLCAASGSYTATQGGDCDDAVASTNPSAPELCNNSDDNCDGRRDEGVAHCACANGGDPAASDTCGDGEDNDCNSLVDDLCCDASDAFTFSTPAPTCMGGAINVPLVHLIASSTCANTLLSLRVDRHPASTTLDDGLTGAYLYHDVDRSGTLTRGDVLLAGPVSMSTGVLQFDNVGLGVQGGSSASLMVVGSRSQRDSYFAGQIISRDAFTTLDTVVARQLASTPLIGTAHSLADRRCSGSSTPDDLGVGTQAASAVSATGLGVIHYTAGGNLAAWGAGAGSEEWWVAGAGQNPTVTADCNLQTEGTQLLMVTDTGASSQYLHIDTAVPLGLPLCGLTMRVYSSRYSNNQCRYSLLGEHVEAHLYAYNGRYTVDADSQSIQEIVETAGPNTSRGCSTDYADFDLTSVYAKGGGTGTLNVRFIVDAGDGIDASANTRINSIAEIYIQAH